MTSPNPMVGAALVKGGKIIGRGWHRWTHLDTTTNDGRANLPVCPNLTASQRSNAGGTLGIRTREHRSARSCGSLGGAAAPPYLGGGVKLRPAPVRTDFEACLNWFRRVGKHAA
jgi:hypothetical protein